MKSFITIPALPALASSNLCSAAINRVQDVKDKKPPKKIPINHHEGRPHCDYYIDLFDWKAHFSLQPYDGGRYSECEEQDKWGKHTKKVLEEKHRCHTWDRGFHAFRYGWVGHLWDDEDFECYGNCTILLYSGEDCGGQEVLHLPKANTDENCGACFTADDEDPLLRSARVVCDRTYAAHGNGQDW